MLALFLTQAATGCLVVLLLIPPRAAGRKFFRYTVGQSGALLLLGCGMPASTFPCRPLCLGLFLGAAAASVVSAALFHLGRLRAGSMAHLVALSAGLAGVIGDALRLIPASDASLLSRWHYPLDALTGGLVTGSALIAMILGHYYLNVPGLAIAHLQRLSLTLLIAVAARALVLGVSVTRHRDLLAPLLALLWDTSGQPVPTGLDPFVLVGLILQVLFGVAAPAAFAFMAWRAACISSTQSATGILYVALIAVIMGELASRYIITLTGLAL